MGVMDFLFEGSPPPSVTTYGRTVESMPQWLSDYTQGLIARSNAVAAEPYQTYGGPRIAGFSTDQANGMNLTRNNVGAWQPGVNQAGDMAVGATGAGALSYAQPYLSQAGSMFKDSASTPTYQAAGQYMDPYVQNVIDRGTTLAMRNYNENIMPGLDSKFIRGGQYGSSAHMREANQAARDITEGVQGQALGALSGAYQLAGQQFGADRSAQQNAAQGLGQLGATGADVTLKQAGQQLNSAQMLAGLGQLRQSLGLKDAAALDAIGGQQQQLAQRNMDLAYSDFQNQRDYPRSTLDWMSGVIRGLPNMGGTKTSSETGPAQAYQPSPLAQIAQLGSVWQAVAGDNQ